MGHAEISTTLTYYSKHDESDDVRARWALNALMSGSSMQDLNLSDAKVTPEGKTGLNRRVG